MSPHNLDLSGLPEEDLEALRNAVARERKRRGWASLGPAHVTDWHEGATPGEAPARRIAEALLRTNGEGT